MGVPRFYRFLSERYPQINEKIEVGIGETRNSLLGSRNETGFLQRIQDGSGPVPIDCLYLDLNGVAHNATHANSADGRIKVKSSRHEIWINILSYIDKLVAIAQPRRLLFIGVDGVAPRAKMNQQRSRRFRSARDRQRREAQERETGDRPSDADLTDFDSNCITPGTEFMCELIRQLRFFIAYQVEHSSLWSHLEVVLSGPDIPGEGEHKIMQYIRSMRSRPDFPRDLCHCIQGLDADLIMLALMSHEPRFVLLREEVNFDFESRWKTEEKRLVTGSERFILLHVSLIREYLVLDCLHAADDAVLDTPLEGVVIPRTIDHERIIDDFLLVVTLAGNDFLPHLQCSDIAKGGLNSLLTFYSLYLRKFYSAPRSSGSSEEPWLLGPAGHIHWARFAEFLQCFCLTAEDEELTEALQDTRRLIPRSTSRKAVAGVAAQLSWKETDLDTQAADQPLEPDEGEDESDEAVLPSVADWVQLRGSAAFRNINDYRDFHYWRKLKFDPTKPELKRQLAAAYLRGLQWNMLYYLDGVPSWSWFYPYHYAPFVQDLVDCLRSGQKVETSFHLGQPFRPIEQLLAVLPPLSARLLPEAYRFLMLGKESPLLGAYPKSFKVDREGEKTSWGGVSLLPFIDENELLLAVGELEKTQGINPDDVQIKGEGSVFVVRSILSEEEGGVQGGSRMSCLGLTETMLRQVDLWGKYSVRPVFLPSTFPTLLEPLSAPKILQCILPREFDFKNVRIGLHESRLLTRDPNVLYPANFPSFRLLASPNTTGSLVTGFASRIEAFDYKEKCVKVFSQVTRNKSLCVNLTVTDGDGIVSSARALENLASNLYQSTNLLRQLANDPCTNFFDFTFLPSVRSSYPFRTIGRVVGIWSEFTGYVPLCLKALAIPCPLISKDVLLDGDRGMQANQLCVDIKQLTLPQTCALYQRAADATFSELIQSGLGFSEEAIRDFSEDVAASLGKLLLAAVDCCETAFRKKVCFNREALLGKLRSAQTVSWKTFMLEVINHAEVAENMAAKPLLRYAQKSKMVFFPQVLQEPSAFIIKSSELHNETTGPPLLPGSAVFSRLDNQLAFGSVGVVTAVNKSLSKVSAAFDCVESPQQSWELQQQLANILARPQPRWLSSKTLAQRLNIPSRVVDWLTSRVPVKRVDKRQRSEQMRDFGLGLVSSLKHPVTNKMEPVAVPGYSFIQIAKNSSQHAMFCPSVETLLLEMQRLLPNLLPCLLQQLKNAHTDTDHPIPKSKRPERSHSFYAERISLDSALFPTRELNLFERWLNSQQFRTIGVTFAGGAHLSQSDIRAVTAYCDQRLHDRALSLDHFEEPIFLADVNASSLRLLASPVTPVKIARTIMLGQRVVVIKAVGRLKLGSRGVIIGLQSASPRDLRASESPSDLIADLLLEELSFGGSDLNGLLPNAMSGARIPLRHILPIPPLLEIPSLS